MVERTLEVPENNGAGGGVLNLRPADYELSPKTPTDTNDDASPEDFRTQD